MRISKKITKAAFEYSDESRELRINGDIVRLGKVEMLSLMRFLIRIVQRNWYKRAHRPQPKLPLGKKVTKIKLEGRPNEKV